MIAQFQDDIKLSAEKGEIINCLKTFNKGRNIKLFEEGNEIFFNEPISFWSWGERVTVTLVDTNLVRVRSSCKLKTQVFDWGKNRRNVEQVISVLKAHNNR